MVSPPASIYAPKSGEEQRAPGGDGAHQRGAPQEEHPGRGVPEGGGQAACESGGGIRVANARFSRQLRPCPGPGEVGRFLFLFFVLGVGSRVYVQPTKCVRPTYGMRLK